MAVHPLKIVLACVFFDTLGVGLIIPCLVQLFTSLGATASNYGLLSSLYGVGQLLGSPVCGALCDRLGTKPILMASFIGSCLSYGSMGFANSLWVLAAARVAVGLIKQTQTVGIAYVVGVTDVHGRTKAMAWFATASSVGFVFGPVTGSLLSRIDLRIPFFVSSAIYALTTVLAAFFLPNVKPDRSALEGFDPLCPITGKAGECVASTSEKEEIEEKGDIDTADADAGAGAADDSDEIQQVQSLSDAVKTFVETTQEVVRTLIEMVSSSREMAMLVLMRFMLSACLMTIESTMLMYLGLRFEMDSRSNGMVLGFFGLTGVGVNQLVVSRLTKYFKGETNTIAPGFLMGSLGFFLLALSPTFSFFLVGVVVFCFGLYTTRACLLTMFTQMAPPARRGAYLGVGGSLESFCRVVIPVIAGILLDQGVGVPFVICGVVQGVLALVWYYQVVKKSTHTTVGTKLEPLKKKN